MRISASIRAAGCGALLVGSLLLGGAGLSCAQDAPAAAPAGAPASAAAHRPFILMVELTVKPDREQDFLKLLQQMKQRVVHQDHGNLVYELFAVAPARPAGAAAAAQGAASAPAHQYVFLEEWRDQAAAAAHGKWAGPIVRTSWREMTESMRLVPLDRVALR